MTPVLYMTVKKAVKKVKDAVVEVSSPADIVEVINGNGAVQGAFSTQEEAVAFATMHGFRIK